MERKTEKKPIPKLAQIKHILFRKAIDIPDNEDLKCKLF